MNDFQNFITALSADARLGRFISPLAGQAAEVIILSLAMALADACEGNQPHGALALLERMQEVGR